MNKNLDSNIHLSQQAIQNQDKSLIKQREFTRVRTLIDMPRSDDNTFQSDTKDRVFPRMQTFNGAQTFYNEDHDQNGFFLNSNTANCYQLNDQQQILNQNYLVEESAMSQVDSQQKAFVSSRNTQNFEFGNSAVASTQEQTDNSNLIVWIIFYYIASLKKGRFRVQQNVSDHQTHNASHEESMQSLNDHNNAHIFQINQTSEQQILLTEESTHHGEDIDQHAPAGFSGCESNIKYQNPPFDFIIRGSPETHNEYFSSPLALDREIINDRRSHCPLNGGIYSIKFGEKNHKGDIYYEQNEEHNIIQLNQSIQSNQQQQPKKKFSVLKKQTSENVTVQQSIQQRSEEIDLQILNNEKQLNCDQQNQKQNMEEEYSKIEKMRTPNSHSPHIEIHDIDDEVEDHLDQSQNQKQEEFKIDLHKEIYQEQQEDNNNANQDEDENESMKSNQGNGSDLNNSNSLKIPYSSKHHDLASQQIEEDKENDADVSSASNDEDEEEEQEEDDGSDKEKQKSQFEEIISNQKTHQTTSHCQPVYSGNDLSRVQNNFQVDLAHLEDNDADRDEKRSDISQRFESMDADEETSIKSLQKILQVQKCRVRDMSQQNRQITHKGIFKLESNRNLLPTGLAAMGGDYGFMNAADIRNRRNNSISEDETGEKTVDLITNKSNTELSKKKRNTINHKQTRVINDNQTSAQTITNIQFQRVQDEKETKTERNNNNSYKENYLLKKSFTTYRINGGGIESSNEKQREEQKQRKPIHNNNNNLDSQIMLIQEEQDEDGGQIQTQSSGQKGSPGKKVEINGNLINDFQSQIQQFMPNSNKDTQQVVLVNFANFDKTFNSISLAATIPNQGQILMQTTTNHPLLNVGQESNQSEQQQQLVTKSSRNSIINEVSISSKGNEKKNKEQDKQKESSTKKQLKNKQSKQVQLKESYSEQTNQNEIGTQQSQLESGYNKSQEESEETKQIPPNSCQNKQDIIKIKDQFGNKMTLKKNDVQILQKEQEKTKTLLRLPSGKLIKVEEESQSSIDSNKELKKVQSQVFHTLENLSTIKKQQEQEKQSEFHKNSKKQKSMSSKQDQTSQKLNKKSNRKKNSILHLKRQSSSKKAIRQSEERKGRFTITKNNLEKEIQQQQQQQQQQLQQQPFSGLAAVQGANFRNMSRRQTQNDEFLMQPGPFNTFFNYQNQTLLNPNSPTPMFQPFVAFKSQSGISPKRKFSKINEQLQFNNEIGLSKSKSKQMKSKKSFNKKKPVVVIEKQTSLQLLAEGYDEEEESNELSMEKKQKKKNLNQINNHKKFQQQQQQNDSSYFQDKNQLSSSFQTQSFKNEQKKPKKHKQYDSQTSDQLPTPTNINENMYQYYPQQLPPQYPLQQQQQQSQQQYSPYLNPWSLPPSGYYHMQSNQQSPTLFPRPGFYEYPPPTWNNQYQNMNQQQNQQQQQQQHQLMQLYNNQANNAANMYFNNPNMMISQQLMNQQLQFFDSMNQTYSKMFSSMMKSHGQLMGDFFKYSMKGNHQQLSQKYVKKQHQKKVSKQSKRIESSFSQESDHSSTIKTLSSNSSNVSKKQSKNFMMNKEQNRQNIFQYQQQNAQQLQQSRKQSSINTKKNLEIEIPENEQEEDETSLEDEEEDDSDNINEEEDDTDKDDDQDGEEEKEEEEFQCENEDDEFFYQKKLKEKRYQKRKDKGKVRNLEKQIKQLSNALGKIKSQRR